MPARAARCATTGQVGVGDQGQGGADFQLFTQTPNRRPYSGSMIKRAPPSSTRTHPAFLETASLPNAPISVRANYKGVRDFSASTTTARHVQQSGALDWKRNIPEYQRI